VAGRKTITPHDVPLCVQGRSALLFKLTSSGHYNCTRSAFRRAGFKPTQGNNWNVMWGKALKMAEYTDLDCFQKVNHFPGAFLLGRKDNLARACARFRRVFGADMFEYLPKTFVLPGDRADLVQP